MRRSLIPSFLFAALVAFLLHGCAQRDDSVAPDIEAPVITVLSPSPGDTVGIDLVTVIFQAVDDIGVTKVDLSVDDAAPSATVTAEPWKATLSIAALADGPHTIVLKAYDNAGSMTEKRVQVVKGLKKSEEVPRMTLVEIVTSANCVPCAPANEAFKKATDDDYHRARMAVIKYHAWFPRSSDSLWKVSQTWARPRITYLFLPIPIANASAPNTWVSGVAAGASAQNWISMTNADINVKPEARIDLEKQDVGGRIQVTVRVRPLASLSGQNLRLHTVVTESDIHYNDGNAEDVHYDVMRTMLPDADGEAITLTPGQTSEFTRTIDMEPRWVRANCSVVVFVQNPDTKHVLQAAKIHLQ